MSGGTYITRPNRALRIYAVIFLTVLYAPVLAIPLFSVNDSVYVRFPLQGFTLQWYVDLWSRTAVLAALGNSVRVGVCVAVVATGLGLLAARAISLYRLPGQNAIIAFAMLPPMLALVVWFLFG